MTTLSLNRRDATIQFAWPILSSAAVIFLLYFWLPYASGYADHRISIFKFAQTLWNGGEDWQHCYLVPVGVIAMIYYSRKHLATLPLNGSWTGLIVLLFGLFVYWVGFRADNVCISAMPVSKSS